MPIIMTIDTYDDQIENNLAMVQLITQERKQKENQVIVYGKAFPNDIWEKIKEYNAWTDERREIRNMYAQHNQQMGLYKNIYAHRAGRIAPTVRIGDEICDGDRLCGRVVKIQKASVDIERYSYVGYRRTFVADITPNGSSVNVISIYKWKKNVVKKMRLIGTYQLGDNGGGFVMNTTYTDSRFEARKYSNEGWIMGTNVITEQLPYCGRFDCYGSN